MSADDALGYASQVPDYGDLYRDPSDLSPRMAARLWEAADCIMTNYESYPPEDAAEYLLELLPPIARRQGDSVFVAACASRIGMVRQRLADGVGCQGIATCTGDEVALHLVISVVVMRHDGECESPWIEALPARPDDEDFDRADELLLEDDDVLMLYNPALDGVEEFYWTDEPFDHPVKRHPSDWFTPFP